MSEIDYLKLKLEDKEKAFDRLHKLHMELLKKQGELEKENEQLKKDLEYWKQVASQCRNELNVFDHCKRYKTECKDIYWSSD